MILPPAITNTLIMAAYSFTVTTVAIIVAAKVEKKPARAPVNAISHIVFGDKALNPELRSPLYFGTGLVLNLGAMIGWSAGGEIGFRVLNLPAGQLFGSVLIATIVSLSAYVTDFHIVPKRFTPGFEHIISHRSLAIVYVCLASSLAVAGLQRFP